MGKFRGDPLGDRVRAKAMGRYRGCRAKVLCQKPRNKTIPTLIIFVHNDFFLSSKT